MCDTPETPLSVRVREMTRFDHHEAESSGFITELMGGCLSAGDYALLLAQYVPLYAALEGAVSRLRSTTSSGFTELFDPGLDRLECIRLDLSRLLPQAELAAPPSVLRATQDYVHHLSAIASDPVRIAAHHYLRYLGDLSGGQAIGRLMARHYGLSPDQLSMYTFAHIEKPKIYKDDYRRRLDTLDLDTWAQDAFVEEAALGFRLTRAVFDELGEASRRQHLVVTG